MARVTVWNSSRPEVPAETEHDQVLREEYAQFLRDNPDRRGDLTDEQPCPACRGRGDDDCLTCGGEGYV